MVVGILTWALFLSALLVMSPARAEQPSLLFFDDFAQDEIGAVPANWYLSIPGRAEVVDEPALASGKAVLVRSDADQERDTHFRGPAWDLQGTDPETIAVEFQVRWLMGRGINIYASGSRGHFVNLHISDGGLLRYREPQRYIDITTLPAGWNRIKFVANRVKNEVYVYLNDMAKPIAGPYPFRTPLDSWQGVYVLVLHSVSAAQSGAAPEALYGDFKVWAVE